MTKSVIHITTCVKQILLRLFKANFVNLQKITAYSSRILMCHRRKHKCLILTHFLLSTFLNYTENGRKLFFSMPIIRVNFILEVFIYRFLQKILNLVMIIILSDHIKMKIFVRHIYFTKLYSRTLNVIIFYLNHKI